MIDFVVQLSTPRMPAPKRLNCDRSLPTLPRNLHHQEMAQPSTEVTFNPLELPLTFGGWCRAAFARLLPRMLSCRHSPPSSLNLAQPPYLSPLFFVFFGWGPPLPTSFFLLWVSHLFQASSPLPSFFVGLGGFATLVLL